MKVLAHKQLIFKSLKRLVCGLTALLLISCNGDLSGVDESIDDGDFSSTPPIQISGTYLGYKNARIRCQYQEMDFGYRSYCTAVANLNGHEVKPVGILAGTDISWSEPKLEKGLDIFTSSSCKVSEDKLSQVCDLKMSKGDAKFVFNVELKEKIRKRTEEFVLLFPYAINLVTGTNIKLPYFDAFDKSSSKLLSGFNFKSISAFAGKMPNNVGGICAKEDEVFFSHEDGVYIVKDDKVSLFASSKMQRSNDRSLAKTLQSCSKDGCRINLACDEGGMYIAESQTQSLLYLDDEFNASTIDATAIQAVSGLFDPRYMKINKKGGLYFQSGSSIFKVEDKKVVPVLGDAKAPSFFNISSLTEEDVKSLDPLKLKFYSINDFIFNENDDIEFVANNNTLWSLKSGKLSLLKAGVYAYYKNFPDKYSHYYQSLYRIFSQGGKRHFIAKRADVFGVMSLDPKLSFISKTTNPEIPFLRTLHSSYSILKMASNSKNTFMFMSYAGILKFLDDKTFEVIAGAPSKDPTITGHTHNFAAAKLKNPELIKSIGDVQALVELKDGSTVYSDLDLDVLMKVSKSGDVSIYAGGGASKNVSSGSVQDLKLSNPYGLALMEDDSIIVSDSGHDRLIKIKGDYFETIAGAYSDFNDPLVIRAQDAYCMAGQSSALGAKIDSPGGIAVDHVTGDIYFSSYTQHCVQKINIRGEIHTILGDGTPTRATPGALVKDSGIYKPMDVSLSEDRSTLYVTELSLFKRGNDEVGEEDVNTGGRVISIDLKSDDSRIILVTDNIQNFDGQFSTPASVGHGNNGEIILLDSGDGVNEISVMKMMANGSYKKVSLLKNLGTYSECGNGTSYVKGESFKNSLQNSLNSVCVGKPVRFSIRNNCSESNGKVSLSFSQRAANISGSSRSNPFSLVDGNSIYKVTWPCDADLFAE